MLRYLKEAFWARADLPMIGALPVNALAVAGLGVFGLAEHAVWLIGLGLETGYLFLVANNPRFQRVIDGQRLLASREGAADGDERKAVFRAISMQARLRYEKQEEKVRAIGKLSRTAGEEDHFLLESNMDPLRKLCALHLRLLSAQARLQADAQPDKEGALARQAEALEAELAAGGGRMTATLRESKEATLDLTRKRLANAQKSRDTLAEIESDLERIETQLDLALENVRLDGRPTVVAGNLKLLNQILESNSALSGTDTAFLQSEG